jgi:CHAT domain-containing protein
MKLIRWLSLSIVVLSCTSAGFISPNALGSTLLGITPVAQVSSQTPVKPLSALKLDLKQLSQTLDRKDIAAAVQQVELGWKQQYEDYYQGQLASQLLSVEQIGYSLKRIARLTGRRTALLYAISTPEHLELMLVTPTGKPIHRRIRAASRQRLAQTIQNFRLGIVNTSSQPSAYLPAAQQLYQWIIAPLEAELKAQKIDTLIFCLGGGLRSVPMAALHDGQRFLVENYNLAIIPAFSLLDQQPSRLAGVRVLAMGASQFEEQPPLPAVPAELTTISKLWGGEAWLNQDFTLKKLRARRSAASFGIVHLATHATLAPGSVDTSYIQFWDQQVRLDRVRDLGLRFPVVQLLVLSACETALGDLNAELGFAGLAVQSGAKAAISSLWSVSDAGTLALMTRFYQQLKSAPIKAEALRRAQVSMIRKPILKNRSFTSAKPMPMNTNLSHPYYWAAFTVIGNPW